MFLRKNKRVKDGKAHVYWSLVETIRTPKGPRQRVVGYLGDMNEESEAMHRSMVTRFKGQDDSEPDFFRPACAESVSVLPSLLRVEKVRDFGDAWVGAGLWRLLELDKFFSKQIGEGKEDVPWESIISFLSISRFCESMSKLSIVERYLDKRSDCKQVTLALVVTKEGFPLFFEVFDGNRLDVTTVEDIVEHVESVYGCANRVWVMDRGMVSDDNLMWLRERGTSYIVGTPKAMLKQFEKQLLDSDWENVYPDVEVKLANSPEHQNEVFIICRSMARRDKEKAMKVLFVERIEAGLKKLSIAVSREKRALKDRDELLKKIGALLKVNSRAAIFFKITVEEKNGRLVLTWDKKVVNDEWSDLSAGCYLLRSNLSKEMTAVEFWKAYIGLTEVEDSFRMSKHDLGLRPVWHHYKERVQSHIFICFLSLVIQRTMEHGLACCGLGRSTRKVLEELRGLKSMDVILPTTEGTELKMKVVSEPDPALKIILDRLNIRCPKRLKLLPNVVEKLTSPPSKNQLLRPLLST